MVLHLTGLHSFLYNLLWCVCAHARVYVFVRVCVHVFVRVRACV